MKKLFLFLSLVPLLCLAQKKDCKYDFEEKTDTTFLKALPDKLVYEKIFGTSKEFIQFKLLNHNGVPTLSFQQIQKSQDFIPVKCFDAKSKIVFQLESGKIVSLLSVNTETCSTLTYLSEENSNIRLLKGYFVFTKLNYDELKKSRITVMRVQYTGESKDYIINDAIQSEILNENIKPSSYFIENLECVE